MLCSFFQEFHIHTKPVWYVSLVHVPNKVIILQICVTEMSTFNLGKFLDKKLNSMNTRHV